MGVDTSKRVARRPKSYRGCKACKNARKKCSEAKPECAFCIRNGLKCEYDINFVLRFETFVDGKQPRRRSTNKSKDCDRVRKLSGDAIISDDSSTVPSTPTASCSDISDHVVKSEVDLQLVCRADSPETPEFQDVGYPELDLCQRYPSFFDHDPEDTPYMEYFRIHVGVVLPYFGLFPQISTEILTRATTDRGLFHTVLSVSHLVADSRLHRSLVPAYHHQTQALSLLQQSISSTNITETLAISVAMLAWINTTRSNRTIAFQHLHGLYLIFQEIHNQRFKSPLLMQIWRFSIRLEILSTVFYFPRTPLFPPVPVDDDHLHRNWIRASTQKDVDTEWTLASFALDNLMHRACHIAAQAYDLRSRSCGGRNIQIQKWVQGLLVEHAEWSQRPIIQLADAIEKDANSPPPEEKNFLDYPPLRVRDNFYANLLNAWRAIYIFIDLIAVPEIGPVGGKTSKRYLYAVDICRTYASLGKDDMFPIGKVMSVFLTGVALGGKRSSPKEVGWIYDFMLSAFFSYIPLSRSAAISFEEVWEMEGNYWDAMAMLSAGLSSESMLQD